MNPLFAMAITGLAVCTVIVLAFLLGMKWQEIQDGKRSYAASQSHQTEEKI